MKAAIAAVEWSETLRELLSYEGNAANIYGETMVAKPLPWPEFAAKKIPTHWRAISYRVSGGRNRVRDARDPFNALLNYGYTLLEVETRIACVAEGLDPDLGYLHIDERLRESFVYDLLELLRVEVDRLTLEWTRNVGDARSRGLRPWMFIELRDGVVRLDPDAARNYSQVLMPQLRGPALRIAGDFASLLRRITIPYRLADGRKALKRKGPTVGVGGPCGYCEQPLPKSGLKFCNRSCYLRYSVEIAKPIEKAHARLASLRDSGAKPGWSTAARKKREARKEETLRKRLTEMTPEQRRARKADRQRQYRTKACSSNVESLDSGGN